MAGPRSSCGVRNHGQREDNKLSGMSDGSPVHSENLREDESLFAMRGSADLKNRSDRKDREILEMTGPRNQNERLENKQLVEEEDEEMEVDVVGLDENQIREYVKGQSRSRFAMVRRKFAEGKKWYAQVMRPRVLNGKLFTSSEYDTDVEAAVAASVAARVFEIKVSTLPRPQNGRRLPTSKPPFKFHYYLIDLYNNLNNSPLPDTSENEDMKEFVKACVELFVQTVKDAENGIERMLEQDKGMAEAIRLYPKAIRYDQKYNVWEVPPSRRRENKRKRNLVESDGAASGPNASTSLV